MQEIPFSNNNLRRYGGAPGSGGISYQLELACSKRRWGRGVTAEYRNTEWLHFPCQHFQYFNSKILSATVLSKMFFFYSLFLLVEY